MKVNAILACGGILILLAAGCTGPEANSESAANPAPAASPALTVETAPSQAVASPAVEALPTATTPLIAASSPAPTAQVPSILRLPETSPTPPLQPTDDYPPRITVEQARQLIASGKAVFVDVRGKQYYDEDHIEGALSIPLDELAARSETLPKGKTIITYCT